MPHLANIQRMFLERLSRLRVKRHWYGIDAKTSGRRQTSCNHTLVKFQAKTTSVNSPSPLHTEWVLLSHAGATPSLMVTRAAFPVTSCHCCIQKTTSGVHVLSCRPSQYKIIVRDCGKSPRPATHHFSLGSSLTPCIEVLCLLRSEDQTFTVNLPYEFIDKHPDTPTKESILPDQPTTNHCKTSASQQLEQQTRPPHQNLMSTFEAAEVFAARQWSEQGT